MALYRYTAKASDGRNLSGRIEADNVEAVSKALHERNLLVMDIRKDLALSTVSLPGKKKVNIRELALFCRQFHTMLNAGINTLECLEMLKDQVSDRNFKSAVIKLHESIQLGSMLSAAMRQHPDVFPQILSSMAEVGELSGTLAESMERSARYFDKEHKTNQRVRSAMAYPSVILVVVVLVVAFLLVFIVPRFLTMFVSQNVELPLPTRILVSISGKNAIVPFLAISGFALVVMIMKKTAVSGKGRNFTDNLLIKLPVIGNYTKRLASYRFTKTLSELLYAKVPLISALEMCSKVLGNSVYSRKIDKVIESVNLGFRLNAAFSDTGIFQPMIIKMIRIGEEAGTLDSMTEKASEYYEGELDASITKMITMIEPVMILALAIVAGFIVISMMLPMFSSYRMIGG